MFHNKTAVITGGSRGIGRAAALAFAENGADIAVIYAGNAEAARDVVAAAESFGVKASAYQCDVSDPECVRRTCEEIQRNFPCVDILVNNAGVTKDGLLLRMRDADYQRVISVNLNGAFYFIRGLSRMLMKSGAGRIINLSSVSGIAGNAGQANYSAAKAGLIGLTKTVAKELASRGVTCNAVAPGFIETDMTATLPSSVAETVKIAVPLGRMGTPGEVADLILFLASPRASYITGAVIQIDGGLFM